MTTTTPLRVALLRGDDHHNLYLESLLRTRFDVVATVSEPGVAQRKALRNRAKWKDSIAAEYHHLRRTVLRLNARRARFFADARAADGLAAPPSPHLTVSSINDPRVAEMVRRAQPDVCVITCTTILSESTIASIGVDIINIHGGHLPDYRGCHCFFFALLRREFDKIGSTIHFVNRGIDTGKIVEIVRPAITPGDDAESLYSKAERLAAHRLCHWLELSAIGAPIPSTPQPFRGRLYLRRHRLPHHDIMFALARLTGRITLPTVPEGERWFRPR